MLDINQATEIVKNQLPNGKIQARVVYRDLYLFQVFGDDPLEGQMDPFYSVNKETGEFSEFSLLTDGDISEVVSLFKETSQQGGANDR